MVQILKLKFREPFSEWSLFQKAEEVHTASAEWNTLQTLTIVNMARFKIERKGYKQFWSINFPSAFNIYFRHSDHSVV
jgi:hypothetical protein